jgi:hypothetical protein
MSYSAHELLSSEIYELTISSEFEQLNNRTIKNDCK